MLTVPQAARRVGRDPETVRRWVRSGRLVSSKVGTQHLIREEDLAASSQERIFFEARVAEAHFDR
jgi:excisionase family DNA binding protein